MRRAKRVMKEARGLVASLNKSFDRQSKLIDEMRAEIQGMTDDLKKANRELRRRLRQEGIE